MSTISNLKIKPFISFKFKKFRLNKILFLIFLFGLIYGVMLVVLNNSETMFQCNLSVKNFLEKRINQSMLLTFILSFLNHTLFIILFFLVGFIPISQLICLISPIFYGLGFGLSSAYLIIFKGLEGVLAFFTMILPCGFISILVFIFICKESLRFANKNFMRFICRNSNLNYKIELKIYFIKFLTLIFFQLIASVLDCLGTFIFILLS